MKADLSRITFQEKNHYRKVNMQQGRVQMDADWNEQNDIQFHHEQSFLRDLIGKSGTLRENDGFKILVNDNFGWNDLGDESNPASSSSSLKKFLRENFGLSWIVDSLSFKPDGPDSYILSTNTQKATLKRD